MCSRVLQELIETINLYYKILKTKRATRGIGASTIISFRVGNSDTHIAAARCSSNTTTWAISATEMLLKEGPQGHQIALATSLSLDRCRLELSWDRQIVGHPIVQTTGMLTEAKHVLDGLEATLAISLKGLPVVNGRESTLLSGSWADGLAF